MINFGLDFMEKRGYTLLHTPFFMRKEIMSKCAQLAQFDEELYKVKFLSWFHYLSGISFMICYVRTYYDATFILFDNTNMCLTYVLSWWICLILIMKKMVFFHSIFHFKRFVTEIVKTIKKFPKTLKTGSIVTDRVEVLWLLMIIWFEN